MSCNQEPKTMNFFTTKHKHSHRHLYYFCFTVKNIHSDTLLWLVETYLCGWPDRLLFYRWRWRPQSLHIWGWSESDIRLPRSHKPEASLQSTGTGSKGDKRERRSRKERGRSVEGRRYESLHLNPWTLHWSVALKVREDGAEATTNSRSKPPTTTHTSLHLIRQIRDLTGLRCEGQEYKEEEKADFLTALYCLSVRDGGNEKRQKK